VKLSLVDFMDIPKLFLWIFFSKKIYRNIML